MLLVVMLLRIFHLPVDDLEDFFAVHFVVHTNAAASEAVGVKLQQSSAIGFPQLVRALLIFHLHAENFERFPQR